MTASSPTAAEPRGDAPLRRAVAGALTSLAAGSLAVTVLALGARLWWGFELLTHFRVQYAAVQVLLLGALAICRRPRWCAALAVGLALNAAPLLPYTPRLGVARAAPGDTLSVMTVNVAAGNRELRPLLDIVRRESPDLLLVIELTPAWQAGLAELHPHYPHRLLAPRANAFGLALYSRLPLAAREIEVGTTPAIDAEVATPAGPLRLIGVHLRPPTRAAWFHERNRQLDALAAIAADTDLPLIVLGDFNSTPFSPYLADWLRATGLRTTLHDRGFGISWPTFLPALGIPIDHCAVSAQFAVLEHRRLPAFGSDHYPVLARLALPSRP